MICNTLYPKWLWRKARRLLLEGKISIRSDRLELSITPTGNYWLPADAYGDIIVNAIKKNKIFESEVFDMARRFIRPGTCVLDVGSNFGQMAILMSKCAGNGGIVHAFEADPFIFSILSRNIAENNAAVIAHQAAVHDSTGEKLNFPEQDFNEFQTYGSYGIDYLNVSSKIERLVTTIRIDDINFDAPISFMKIDVQGGDLHVLKGARETIAKYRMPILFEYEYIFEVRQHLSFQEYVDFVRSVDYRFVRVIQGGQNYLILPGEASSSSIDLAYNECKHEFSLSDL
jgi:FkbM family methyltransferase